MWLWEYQTCTVSQQKHGQSCGKGLVCSSSEQQWWNAPACQDQTYKMRKCVSYVTKENNQLLNIKWSKLACIHKNNSYEACLILIVVADVGTACIFRSAYSFPIVGNIPFYQWFQLIFQMQHTPISNSLVKFCPYKISILLCWNNVQGLC